MLSSSHALVLVLVLVLSCSCSCLCSWSRSCSGRGQVLEELSVIKSGPNDMDTRVLDIEAMRRLGHGGHREGAQRPGAQHQGAQERGHRWGSTV